MWDFESLHSQEKNFSVHFPRDTYKNPELLIVSPKVLYYIRSGEKFTCFRIGILKSTKNVKEWGHRRKFHTHCMKQTIFPETGDINLKEFKIKYLFYDFF